MNAWRDGLQATFRPESVEALLAHLRTLGITCVVIPETCGERITGWSLDLIPKERMSASLVPALKAAKYRIIRLVLDGRLTKGADLLFEHEQGRGRDADYEESFALYLRLLTSYELVYPLAEAEMDRAVPA